MGIARIQVAMHRDSELPEDIVTNTWYAVSDTPATPTTETQAEGLVDALNAFYNGIDAVLSEVLTGTCDAKVYEMADAEPRVPIYEDTFSMTEGSDALPSELAICLSFRGPATSGLPAARRRGRIFLGPLARNCLTTPSGEPDVRVSSAAINAIDAAYVALRTAWAAVDDSWNHCVYSPTTDASGTLLSSITAVTNAYIDNAFDIQRRRGAVASSRTVVVP